MVRSPFNSKPLRIVVSGVAAFVTSYIITNALYVVDPNLWLGLPRRWHSVFGLGALLASAADPTWFEGEGVVDSIPWVGIRVYETVCLVFWSSVIGCLYYFLVFRTRRRSNETVEKGVSGEQMLSDQR